MDQGLSLISFLKLLPDTPEHADVLRRMNAGKWNELRKEMLRLRVRAVRYPQKANSVYFSYSEYAETDFEDFERELFALKAVQKWL